MSSVNWLNVYKYTLGSSAILVSLGATFMFLYDLVKTWSKGKENCWIRFRSTARTFYLLVFLHQVTRATLNFIPTPFYVALYRGGNAGRAVQNILDLLPELLFFTTYALILFSWMEIYNKSRKLQLIQYYSGWRACFQAPVAGLVFVVFLLLIVVGIATLCIAFIPAINDYIIVSRIQGILIGVLSLIITVLFFVYYCLLYCTFRTVPRTNMVQSSLRRVTAIAFTYLVFLSVRVVYILLLNDLVRYLRKEGYLPEWAFALVWFLYFIITEQIPICLVLAFTHSFTVDAAPSFIKSNSIDDEEQEHVSALDRPKRKKNLLDELLKQADEIEHEANEEERERKEQALMRESFADMEMQPDAGKQEEAHMLTDHVTIEQHHALGQVDDTPVTSDVQLVVEPNNMEHQHEEDEDDNMEQPLVVTTNSIN